MLSPALCEAQLPLNLLGAVSLADVWLPDMLAGLPLCLCCCTCAVVQARGHPAAHLYPRQDQLHCCRLHAPAPLAPAVTGSNRQQHTAHDSRGSRTATAGAAETRGQQMQHGGGVGGQVSSSYGQESIIIVRGRDRMLGSCQSVWRVQLQAAARHAYEWLQCQHYQCAKQDILLATSTL
jgi:hypothetical protein